MRYREDQHLRAVATEEGKEIRRQIRGLAAASEQGKP